MRIQGFFYDITQNNQKKFYIRKPRKASDLVTEYI